MHNRRDATSRLTNLSGAWSVESGQYAIGDDAIKLAQNQPFRTTGRAANRADSVDGKAVLSHIFEGGGTRFEK